MINLEATTRIHAPARLVWTILERLEEWPTWTESVTRVVPLDPGSLRLGSRARVTQPRLPTLEWTVSEVEEGRSFAWKSSARGVRTVARHLIEPDGDDASRLALSLEQSGPATFVLGWWMKRIGRRYLGMEAQGLRVRSEASAVTSP